MPKRALLASIFLLFLCLVTYGDTLTHRFMIDERMYVKAVFAEEHIYPNPQLTVYSYYRNFGDFFTKSMGHHYAPVNSLLNVGLFSLFQTPFPLYLINLLLFYVNVGLLFVFIYLISRDFIAALLTCIIFCIHPMTGDMLQHITFNILFLQTIFMESGLIALYLYAKGNKPVAYYLLSILAAFLALFCHEIVLLFPLYAAALLFFLTDLKQGRIVKLTTPFVILNFLLIGIWLLMINPRVHVEGINGLHPHSFWDSSANFSHIFFWYLSNLFVPRSIVFMGNMPLLKGSIWLWNFLFFGFLACCGLLIFCRLKRSLAGFALVFFLIGLVFAAPASQTRPDMGVVFEPNWFYFSSVGFYLFIVLSLLKLKKYINRVLFISLLTVLFMFYFISTLKLDIMSRTEISYCKNWLRKFPGNGLAIAFVTSFYNNHRSVKIPADLVPDLIIEVDRYVKDGVPETLDLIQRISSCDISTDQRRELSYKLAAYHCRNGYNDECKQAVGSVLGPKRSPSTYVRLSSVLNNLGAEKAAVILLKECIGLYPRYKEPYLLMGVILANKGHYKEGIGFWQRGMLLDPADPRFMANINEAKHLMK